MRKASVLHSLSFMILHFLNHVNILVLHESAFFFSLKNQVDDSEFVYRLYNMADSGAWFIKNSLERNQAWGIRCKNLKAWLKTMYMYCKNGSSQNATAVDLNVCCSRKYEEVPIQQIWEPIRRWHNGGHNPPTDVIKNWCTLDWRELSRRNRSC